mgnify:CR=1 FL=1
MGVMAVALAAVTVTLTPHGPHPMSDRLAQLEKMHAADPADADLPYMIAIEHGNAERFDDANDVGVLQEDEPTRVVVVRQRPERFRPQRHRRSRSSAA